MLDNKEIENFLNTRYTTKLYNPNKKVSLDDLNTILESLRLAPSSLGLQPWHFFAVSNDVLKSKLVEKTMGDNKKKVQDSSHLIVITSRIKLDDEYIDKYLEDVDNKRKLGESKQQMEKIVKGALQYLQDENGTFYANQAHIALGFLTYTAGLLGVDSTIMGGIDVHGYDEVLNLKEKGLRTLVAVCLGYRSDDEKDIDRVKVRFNTSDVITRFE